MVCFMRVYFYCYYYHFLQSEDKKFSEDGTHSFTTNAAAGRDMYPVFLVRQPRSAVMNDRRSEKDMSVLIHATICE